MQPVKLTDDQIRILRHIRAGESVNDDLGRGTKCIELGSDSTGIPYTVGDEMQTLGLVTLEYEDEAPGWSSYRVYRATEKGLALLSAYENSL